MKYLILAVFFLVNANLVSASEYTFHSFEVPVTKEEKHLATMPVPVDPGQVIAWGKDIVALGEAIYDLVIKGKPTSQTEYTPINVVPRDPVTRNYVEPMELEEASDPIKRKFVLSAKNKRNQEVVRVEYLLMFQVAKYNGKGKYILNAVILPRVRVGYGFDFSSQMRLVGIANKGKASDPVVSIILDMHYRIGSLFTAQDSHNAITLNGLGNVDLN